MRTKAKKSVVRMEDVIAYETKQPREEQKKELVTCALDRL
jgi:hypothetical protein